MTHTAAATLVDLLGETRAAIVDRLRTEALSVAQLAGLLDISEVAIRRHLVLLERDGLVSGETVRHEGPGRPAMRYRLTDKAYRLFPDRSAEFATELMDYLEDTQGRSALLSFLRWRQEQQGERYASALSAAPAGVEPQTERLAELLTDDGFLAEVTRVNDRDGPTFLQLKQGHCAIKDVAREHPEICAYEAALFKRLLGGKISRRQTIAAGAGECICDIAVPASPTFEETSDRRGLGR